MRDNLVEVTLDRKSLDDWQAGISRKFRKNLEIAQAQIRSEWETEMYRQQLSKGEGLWAPLEPSYEKRRNKEHPAATGQILRRTGIMLGGYANGIEFETRRNTVSVVMNYPQVAEIRAKVHQGELAQPKGSHGPRPFNLEKFEEIAFDRFNEAMNRAANE